MTRQKVFLWVAAALFVGWLGYLGYAVAVHRLNPPDIVSRSQLTAASSVVVAEVTVEGGRPSPSVKVIERLRHPDDKGDDTTGPKGGDTINVTNLPSARPPSNDPFPGAEKYLLFLVPDSPDTYRIAGWPRGLGSSTFEPGKSADPFKPDEPPLFRPPLVYPWTDAVQKQMRALGYQIP